MKTGTHTIQCPDYKRCSGCQLQNMSYPDQLLFKQNKVVKHTGHFCRVSPIIGMDKPYHYRNKVTSIFKTAQNRKIVSGIYQAATHGIVQNDNCLIEDEISDRVTAYIRKLVQDMKISVYNENTGEGFLKYVLIRRGFKSRQIMVVLVASSVIFPAKNIFVQALTKRYPDIRTVVVNVNEHPRKMFLGEKQKVIFGNGFIEDTLCGLTFKISPKSFYQVNPVQTEILYNKAIEYAALTGKETVLDAYCGIGTIGLIASKYAGQVIGVESNPDAVKDAIENARRNRIENAYFHNKDAGLLMQAMAEDRQHADVVFMDPPRAGSSRTFLFSVTHLAPKKIVYISCNPETLGRDLFFLCKNGYAVKEIQPVDMFPHTNHVETVCLLIKK